ncbi:MAG: hypothetical protein R2752_05475 [Vicinamibacterales bacterium]
MPDDRVSQLEMRVSADGRRRLAILLVVAIGTLVVLGSAGEIARLEFGHDVVFGLVRLFGLGQEANVPTWFSSVLLLAAGVLAGTIALLPARQDRSFAGQWAALAGVLVLMSLDETAMIHETLPALVVMRFLPSGEVPWYVYYAWIGPGAVVLGLLIWWFVPFWRTLPRPIRRRMTVAVAVYFGGALLLELAEAAWAARFDTERLAYSALWTTQEILEMAGAALFVLALLEYLRRAGVRLCLSCHAPQAGTSGQQSEVTR